MTEQLVEEPEDAVEETPEPDTMGRVPVLLEGVEYQLRPSWEAILTIEKRTGKTLLELASSAGRCLTLNELAIIVFEFMRAEGKQVSDTDPLATTYRHVKEDKLSRLIMKESIYNVNFRVSIVLMGALTGAYDEAGEPQAARKLQS